MCFRKTINLSFKNKLYSKWPFKNTNLLWKSISKIATKDIFVYKVGNVSHDFFTSYIQSFVYTPDKTEHVKPVILISEHKNQCSDIDIYNGLHSYKNIYIDNTPSYTGLSYFKPLSKYCLFIKGFNNLYLAKFIIPKGARYVENDDNEIVSDTILFHKIIV